MVSNSGEPGQGKNGSKKESPIGFVISLVVMTLVAGGAGWVLGEFLKPEEKPEKTAAKAVYQKGDLGGHGKEADGHGSKDGHGKDDAHNAAPVPGGTIVKLEPILVVLRNSENAFMRLELAVVLGEDAEFHAEKDLPKLINDISAFSRTMSLRQISGPSGYLHFREDIIDRARLSSKGAIKDVLILSMVAE